MKKPKTRFEVVPVEDVLKTAVEVDGKTIREKVPKRPQPVAPGARLAQRGKRVPQ